MVLLIMYLVTEVLRNNQCLCLSSLRDLMGGLIYSTSEKPTL